MNSPYIYIAEHRQGSLVVQESYTNKDSAADRGSARAGAESHAMRKAPEEVAGRGRPNEVTQRMGVHSCKNEQDPHSDAKEKPCGKESGEAKLGRPQANVDAKCRHPEQHRWAIFQGWHGSWARTRAAAPPGALCARTRVAEVIQLGCAGAAAHPGYFCVCWFRLRREV